MEYLGHFIFGQGVATDPKKIEAVVHWPTPKSYKQLRGFLGLAGYYRRFVKDFGKLAQPLITLLKVKDVSNGIKRLIKHFASSNRPW